MRDIRAEAYELVEKFVIENVIDQEQCYFMKFLNNIFINHLKDNEQCIV